MIIKSISKTIVTCLLGSYATTISAQQVTNTSGGTASGDNGTASYSVGDMMHISASNTDENKVLASIQYTYSVEVIEEPTAINETTLSADVVPNPTSGLLNVLLDNSPETDLTILVFSLTGDEILSQNISTQTSSLDMSNTPPGVYIMKLMSKNTLVKSFKIIKE